LGEGSAAQPAGGPPGTSEIAIAPAAAASVTVVLSALAPIVTVAVGDVNETVTVAYADAGKSRNAPTTIDAPTTLRTALAYRDTRAD
jgi:hypothetical protein